jgi:hypothetical protein
MTLRERLAAVLAGETPDAVPWFTDLTYWHHARTVDGDLPEKYHGADGLLQLHRDLGVGVYLFSPSLITTEYDSDLFQWGSEPIDEEYSRIIVTSPEGNLEGLAKACPTSYSSAIVEHPVKTVDDLRVVRAWYEGMRFTPNYDAVVAWDESLGGDGFAIPLIPRTPLATLAAQWSGVANMSYIAADAPDEFEETLEVMRRCEDELYRLYAESPCPALEIGENLSAEAMGGMWRRYSRDYYRERCRMLHDAGKKVGCHIDGTLGLLLGDLAEAGIDFPESVVPAPVGDLTLEQIRDCVQPKTIIWGCIPSAMFAEPFDADWVLDFARQAVDVLGRDGNLVLAGADQVPPNGDIELVRRIGELMEELGRVR